MKKCPKCKEVKPIDDFGIDNNRKDGHNPYCKECARAKSRESNRKAYQRPEVRDKINARNRERRRSPEYRAYARALKQTPEYKAKAKALKQAEKYKEQNREYMRRKRQDANFKAKELSERSRQKAKLCRQRNKEHVNARTAVYRAIRKGILPHPTMLKCEWEICQEQAKHYHHHKGYDKENRLNVQALCFTHHGYVSRKVQQ